MQNNRIITRNAVQYAQEHKSHFEARLAAYRLVWEDLTGWNSTIKAKLDKAQAMVDGIELLEGNMKTRKRRADTLKEMRNIDGMSSATIRKYLIRDKRFAAATRIPEPEILTVDYCVKKARELNFAYIYRFVNFRVNGWSMRCGEDDAEQEKIDECRRLSRAYLSAARLLRDANQ